MRPELHDRLKAVYSSGRIYEPDESAFLGDDYEAAIVSAVKRMAGGTAIRFDGNIAFPQDRAFQLGFTEEAGLNSQVWITRLQDSQRLEWIGKHGRPFPILWLRISRIFPAFYHFYNHWAPRGDTGHLDAMTTVEPPSDEWRVFHSRMESELAKDGIVRLGGEEAAETTDFVFDEEYFDENGNEFSEEAGPRLVQASVHDCLFPH